MQSVSHQTTNASFSQLTEKNCVGDLCLIGGDAISGNLFIRNKPICDDSWDINEAQVVCRQMRFSGASRATTNSE